MKEGETSCLETKPSCRPSQPGSSTPQNRMLLTLERAERSREQKAPAKGPLQETAIRRKCQVKEEDKDRQQDFAENQYIRNSHDTPLPVSFDQASSPRILPAGNSQCGARDNDFGTLRQLSALAKQTPSRDSESEFVNAVGLEGKPSVSDGETSVPTNTHETLEKEDRSNTRAINRAATLIDGAIMTGPKKAKRPPLLETETNPASTPNQTDQQNHNHRQSWMSGMKSLFRSELPENAHRQMSKLTLGHNRRKADNLKACKYKEPGPSPMALDGAADECVYPKDVIDLNKALPPHPLEDPRRSPSTRTPTPSLRDCHSTPQRPSRASTVSRDVSRSPSHKNSRTVRSSPAENHRRELTNTFRATQPYVTSADQLPEKAAKPAYLDVSEDMGLSRSCVNTPARF